MLPAIDALLDFLLCAGQKLRGHHYVLLMPTPDLV
jgi:hypothetical protein